MSAVDTARPPERAAGSGFRALLIAQTLSALGDSFSYVASRCWCCTAPVR
ncbi:hypothetical protein [Catellatospora sp. NPDC049609]